MDFFFNNNELYKYYDFFHKNKLVNNLNNINNNNKDIYFTKNNFKYRINEINYNNLVRLINGNTPYIFFEEQLLNSERLIFEPIFDNLFTFNFQIYLDYNNMSLLESYKQYLSNNIFNQNIYPNYPIAENYLFFDELYISIFSDISGPGISNEQINKDNAIIFSKNTIYINEQFLDSSNHISTISSITDEFTNTISSENLILLCFNYTNSTSDTSSICGLTQQNFTHNIDICNNKIIFHKYNSDIFNYQVNDNNLSRAKTLSESLNNKKYFIELSNNDVYNCFIDICENVTNMTNIQNKNRLMEITSNIYNNIDYSFNSHITYSLYNELNNNNNLLTLFNIQTKNLYELHDICLNNNTSYMYSNYSNIRNSHTFHINLIDYLNRDFFDNSLINIPHDIINYNNINFIIKDIRYSDNTKSFNLFDICANQPILYDKSKINILNSLQIACHMLIFKLQFIKEILKFQYNKQILDNDLLNNYSVSEFFNTLNIQNLTRLYRQYEFITNTYDIELDTRSINSLYYNVNYNLQILRNNYNILERGFLFFSNYIIQPINPFINSQNIQFNIVDQLQNDVSKTIIDISNLYNELEKKFNIITISNELIQELSLNKYEDYNTLSDLTEFYLNIKQNTEIIQYELNLRHTITTSSSLSLTLINDASHTDLLDFNNINNYYQELINNMVNLNKNLTNVITSRSLYTFNRQYPNNYIHEYNPPDISYINNSLKPDISNNFYNILNTLNINYGFLSKQNVFNNINYILYKPHILINAYKSTNILFKIDLIYNSYLFRDVYLDTFVLDVVKPDLIPPTLIFNNNNIIINQENATPANISNIINLLIQDISYIELHEDINDHSIIDHTDISYIYSEFITNNINQDVNNLNLSNVTIMIDISNIGDYLDSPIEVIYTIIDKANNQNIIKRNVNINIDISLVQIYFPNRNTRLLRSNNYNIAPLVIDSNTTNNIVLERAKNNIFIVDASSNIYLTKEDSLFNNILSISRISDTLLQYNIQSINIPSIVFSFNRLITIQPIIEEEFEETICCYPPSFYLPIQHNYKLGHNASNRMRLARFIINNNR